ncbi:hypothetical protein GCM10017044_07160 [Kordiimonas sediminis]|uniref:Uncharacterized protein n=1 Tax=Kordiimonas sediminis TaxID=1735581 RepID=A0A919E5C9_9PROT|nr:DUF6489 family protein [Kordiimonas sediminis]GHF15560.1 hypothetical protein GCM10017044_07160 [Kordiimonas sediminis]
MKITINVDCTPEEVRKTMGLPDVTELNDQLIEAMKDRMANGFSPEEMDKLMRTWIAGTGTSIGEMQKAFFSMMGSGSKD